MTNAASASPGHLPTWLAEIMRGLCAMVAARGGRDRSMVPLVVAAWNRLSQRVRRFDRLVARVLAGRPAPLRRAGGRRTAPMRDAAAYRPPFGYAWLIGAIQETAQYRGQVEALLADPAMTALLAAEPAAVRILKPLCRMLGIEQGPAGCRAPPVRAATPTAPPSAVALVAAAMMVRPDGFHTPTDPEPYTPSWCRPAWYSSG